MPTICPNLDCHYGEIFLCGSRRIECPTCRGTGEIPDKIMKHSILINMDTLLKQLGETVKKVHEHSIDIEDPLQDYWGQQYDQLMAYMTLMINSRADIASKLAVEEQCSTTEPTEKEIAEELATSLANRPTGEILYGGQWNCNCGTMCWGDNCEKCGAPRNNIPAKEQ
jgi:hypothetical protein